MISQSLFIQVDPKSSKITVKGQGNGKYPYTMRHDLGRVLAHTFKYPQEYKNSWLLVANEWYSLNEIAEKVSSKYGRKFNVEHAELDMTTPVLRLFELNNIQPFDPNNKDANLPIELTDMNDFIRRLEWE